ncbi:sortase A [Marmoricola sp. OAE513]|uniref:sortase n=1 Tax=Marmoricola sp. OAE513 TaxID=2817894 RepID=UPI001AE4B814
MSTLTGSATTVHTGTIDASPPSAARSTGPGRREALPSLVSQLLLALAALIAWLLVYLLVLSGFETSHDQDRLYGELRSQLAEGTAPVGAPIAAGAPVALVSVPSIDLENLVVVEGGRSEQLKQGPGHMPGSVLPGQAGWSYVTGRSLTYGAPFGRLTDLRKGDTIRVTTGQGEFTFEVFASRREGDRVPALSSADEARLTLVTSAGEGWFSGLRRSETYYVDAKLLGTPVVAGRVTGRDPQGIGMKAHASAGQLAVLALAVQLLVLVLAGAVWAWFRWSRIGAWVTGLPTVLAVLWLVSSLVSRMLPAMI